MTDAASAIALAEAIVSLARSVSAWIISEDKDAPVSACIAALAVMLDREPEARRRIVAACAKDTLLRVQLLDICGAYEPTWPAFGRLRKEIET